MELKFVDRLDPLGALHSKFFFAPIDKIAPEFYRMFGNNAYLVRKYITWHYCIDPEQNDRSRLLGKALGGKGIPWLFASADPHIPDGPPNQEDLIMLERDIGLVDYFNTLVGTDCHLNIYGLHRVTRIEKVLQWLKKTNNPCIYQNKWRITKRMDLTTPDDYIVEAIVAYLIGQSMGLPASSFTFLKPQSSRRTPEFCIDSKELKAVVEVKHFLKFPQSQRENLWLHAYKRTPFDRQKERPYEKLHKAMEHALKGSSNKWAILREPLWQKHINSIIEKIKHADAQLAKAPNGYRKVIVLHSDDPHIIHYHSEDMSSEPSSKNRFETAIELCIVNRKLHNADAIVLLANPWGFPISSGYEHKIYSKGKTVPVPIQKMFSGLQPLESHPVEFVDLGFSIKVPPNETRSVEISPEQIKFNVEGKRNKEKN